KIRERSRKVLVDARTELQNRMTAEKDPNVKQDLDIMIQASTQFIDASDLEAKLLLSYIDVPQAVFFGVRGLLDDQNDAKRYPAAVVRLKRYAGLEAGYEPITKLAMDRTRERLANKTLLGPIKAEIQKSLETNTNYVEGIGQLCQKFHVAGYEEPYAKLKEQLAAYEQFVKQEIVPRCREDFRQPPELYAMSLREFGIDMPVDELTARAKFSYVEIRNQMQALAPLVAKQKG